MASKYYHGAKYSLGFTNQKPILPFGYRTIQARYFYVRVFSFGFFELYFTVYRGG